MGMHALPASPHSRVGQMYDEFSADYDRFVDWPARLVIELPFIEQQLATAESLTQYFYDDEGWFH